MTRLNGGLRTGLIGGLLAAATVVTAGTLSGCGRVGYLDQPAPLFGERAKEQYRAQRAANAEASRQRNASLRRPGEVERESTNQSSGDTAAAVGTQPAGRDATSTSAVPSQAGDNAPPTARDVLDPAQKLTPLSAAPLDGIPSDPRGAQPSLTPQN